MGSDAVVVTFIGWAAMTPISHFAHDHHVPIPLFPPRGIAYVKLLSSLCNETAAHQPAGWFQVRCQREFP